MEILQGVLDGSFQGAVEVDIRVPDDQYERFKEFSPLFITAEVEFEQMGQQAQEHIRVNNLSRQPRVQLLPAMAARRVLLSDSLLRWYLSEGLRVTKVHSAVEFRKDPLFRDFIDGVMRKRREAAQAGDDAEASKQKLVGNSGYGITLLQKSRYTHVHYVSHERAPSEHLKTNFVKSNVISSKTLEVESTPKRLVEDVPLYIGFEVLQGGKEAMLDFYYNCLDYFVDRKNFQLIEIDTDSQYVSLSCELDLERMGYVRDSKGQYRRVQERVDLDYHPLLSIIKPNLREEFMSRLKDNCRDDWEPVDGVHFFPRQCCHRHNALDQKCPGLFKVEAFGQEMSAASSKCYSLVSFNLDPENPCGFQEKVSAKGVQAKALDRLVKGKGVELEPDEEQSEPQAELEAVSEPEPEAGPSTACSQAGTISQTSSRLSFSQIIQETRKGKSFLIANYGIRNERGQGICTYRQEKAPVNVFYTKRRGRKDGNSTAPLKAWFTPYKVIARERARAKALKAFCKDQEFLLDEPEPKKPQRKRLNPHPGPAEINDDEEPQLTRYRTRGPPRVCPLNPDVDQSLTCSGDDEWRREMGLCDNDGFRPPSDMEVSGDEC